MRSIIAVLLAGPLMAQTSAPPVPAWPGDNRPPSDLHGNYVFLDRAASEIVIVIPGSLHGRPDEPPEIIRAPYHNRFDPQVIVSVTQPEPGRYLYACSLANGKSAIDTLSSWEIAGTCGGAVFRIEARPSGWHCGRLRPSSVRQYALPYIAGPVCPIVCFLDREQSPDSASEELTFLSALRPGLTTVSAGDYKGYPVMKLPHDLPDAITAQLAKLGDSVQSRKDSITIGPRFDDAVTPSQIADDFLQGLTQLDRAGMLGGDSGFVKHLRPALTQAAQTGRLNSARLSTPSTELEREITEAVKLSLTNPAR